MVTGIGPSRSRRFMWRNGRCSGHVTCVG